MELKPIFSILLVVVALIIVSEKNNLRLIIYFSVYSLIMASLYFFNQAPDVALAEVAIGSAFIPFVYIITISKQQTFTVVGNIKSRAMHALLDDFCRHFGLKLQIAKDEPEENVTISGVFRVKNIDLIVNENKETGRIDLIGNASSLMMKRLEEMIKDYDHIAFVEVSDYETDD